MADYPEYDLDSLASSRAEFKVGGVLTNSTVTVTVTSPTGVATNPSATNESTGVYRVDVLGNEVGLWTVLWDGDGAVNANDTTHFLVRRAGT